MIGIWTDSQLIPVVVPSLQRISEAAFTIAESESLVFEPLKNALEFTRNLTAFEDPRVIENAGPKETEHELPAPGVQVPCEAEPHAALVLASIKSAVNAVEPFDAA